MERCLRILNRHRMFFHNRKNVVGVGAGMKQVGLELTDQPSIIIFVEKKERTDDLHREHVIPRQINGVLTDVVEIGKVRLLDGRTEKKRPASPGVSIGHYKVTAGTFGAVVRDVKTGQKLILSNNHILANISDGRDGRAALGDAVLQPAAYDGGTEKDKIAELLRFVPLMRMEKPADCPMAVKVANLGSKLVHMVKPNYDLRFIKQYRGSNVIDAAVARPLSPDMVSEEILGIGAPRGVGTAEVKQPIMKSGRSSGITNGVVTAVDVSLQIDLDNRDKGMFSGQVVSDMKSLGGDSGSLVLDDRHRAVGLLFAGSEKYTIFNQLKNVFARLGVEL